MQTEYVVRTSCAPSKPSWKWKHNRRHVAVLEVDAGTEPKMISTRARGVRRIVAVWSTCYVSRTGTPCQYSRAIAEAKALAWRLEDERAHAHAESMRSAAVDAQMDVLATCRT